MVVLLLVILVIYVTMVYGPIGAWLVELFPARIRYTSMSLPYHIGNGWFGGFLPTIAFALVAATGDIYYGLWYPIAIAADDLRGRLAVHEGLRHAGLHPPLRLASRRDVIGGPRCPWRRGPLPFVLHSATPRHLAGPLARRGPLLPRSFDMKSSVVVRRRRRPSTVATAALASEGPSRGWATCRASGRCSTCSAAWPRWAW